MKGIDRVRDMMLDRKNDIPDSYQFQQATQPGPFQEINSQSEPRSMLPNYKDLLFGGGAFGDSNQMEILAPEPEVFGRPRQEMKYQMQP